MNVCPHCGLGHPGSCSRVRAIEYWPNGMIKKIEYTEVAVGDDFSKYTGYDPLTLAQARAQS